jgi:hypothetical protein
MKGFYSNFAGGDYKDFSMTTGMFGGMGRYNWSVRDNITITIKNTTSTAQEVDLMSRVQPAGVVVASDTVPIQGLITRLQANPMMFTSMKISASRQEQLDNPILLTYKSALGQLDQSSITPNAYKSSFQTISNMVEVTGIEGVLDVDSSIVTMINPNTTLTLTLKVKQLFDNKREFFNYMEYFEVKKYRNFMRVINV